MDIRDGDEADIWIYEWARDAMYRLTTHPGQDVSPVWSPDGRWIAFSSTRGDQRTPNLYCQRADGTGEVLRLTESATPQFPTSWHPSGRFLAFNDTSGRTHISILELSGDEASGWKPAKASALQDSPSIQNNAAFSPDGRWVAYASSETGSLEVYVRSFPGAGGRVRVSTERGPAPDVVAHAQRTVLSVAAGRQRDHGRPVPGGGGHVPRGEAESLVGDVPLKPGAPSATSIFIRMAIVSR